jgi:CDP-paratose 2-epimerase
VDAIEAAWANLDGVRGRAFNIGGGADSTLTPLELLDLLQTTEGLRTSVSFAPWRLADQRYYVSDVRSFRAATGWTPRTSVREGLRRLCEAARGATAAAGAGAGAVRPSAAGSA